MLQTSKGNRQKLANGQWLWYDHLLWRYFPWCVPLTRTVSRFFCWFGHGYTNFPSPEIHTHTYSMCLFKCVLLFSFLVCFCYSCSPLQPIIITISIITNRGVVLLTIVEKMYKQLKSLSVMKAFVLVHRKCRVIPSPSILLLPHYNWYHANI